MEIDSPSKRARYFLLRQSFQGPITSQKPHITEADEINFSQSEKANIEKTKGNQSEVIDDHSNTIERIKIENSDHNQYHAPHQLPEILDIRNTGGLSQTPTSLQWQPWIMC